MTTDLKYVFGGFICAWPWLGRQNPVRKRSSHLRAHHGLPCQILHGYADVHGIFVGNGTEVFPVVVPGQRIEVRPGDFRTISNTRFFGNFNQESGLVTSFNDNRALANVGPFDEGTYIFTLTVAAPASFCGVGAARTGCYGVAPVFPVPSSRSLRRRARTAFR